MIQVQCPSCKEHLMASDEQAGTMMPCRHCGAWVTVPAKEKVGAQQEDRIPCPFCANHILIRASDVGIPISCPHCRQMLRVAHDPVTGRLLLLAGDKELVKQPVPWENRAELGTWKALWLTFRGALFTPTDFFRRMPTSGLDAPMLYVIIISVVIAMGSILHRASWYLVLKQLGFTTPKPRMLSLDLLSFILTLLLLPIVAIISILIVSAISHLALVIVGGARTRLETTCRVFAYSNATALFGFIPLCGGIIGAVWFIVIATIGLRELNQTGTGPALAAVLAPTILLILCCVSVVLAVFGVAWMSGIGP